MSLTMSNKLKICLNNPIWLSSLDQDSYLGLRDVFGIKFCDYIFFSSYKIFLKWLIQSDPKFILNILKNKKILFSTDSVNQLCDVFLTMNNPSYDELNFNKDINIFKINALYDYNFHPRQIKDGLLTSSVDYLIGHNRHDMHDPFFQYFFEEYKEKVIVCPFGYSQNKIKKYINNSKIYTLNVLGAIAPIDISRVGKNNELKEYQEFMTSINRSFSHEYRNWFRNNLRHFPDKYKIILPSGKINRLEEVNEQEIISKSFFTHIDTGSLNFLPARTYEALALKSMLFGGNKSLYKETNIPSWAYLELDDIENMNHSKIQERLEEASHNFNSYDDRLESIKDNFSFQNLSIKLYEDIKSLLK